MPHTPGPWLNGHWHDGGAIGIRASGFTVINDPLASVNAPRVLVDGYPSVTEACVEVAEANARLIAASPALLHACKEARDVIAQMGSGDAFDAAMAVLVAAIDQAEGLS